MNEVRAAVDNAEKLLADCGIDVDVTADQLWEWFETDLPVPDIELGDVIVNPLLVVHELVEIDEVLKMGLTITKDVIVRNPGKIDDAHLKAARIDLAVAETIRATEHLKEMTKSIERWCLEKTLAETRRAEYRQLLFDAKKTLASLTR